MSTPKTQRNNKSVKAYLKAVDPTRSQDCQTLYDIMSTITKDPGSMWGTEIVGFGSYHYTYASGTEGDWFLTGFSSRKQSISIYMVPQFDQRDQLLAKLGKYKMGKSCLSIKSLDDINIPTLKKLLKESVIELRAKHKS